MLEEERKYEVGPDFTMPDLAGALPSGGQVTPMPPVHLTATYFDTPDLRLARAGVSLRHRRGDKQPWTVKLPAGGPGIRHEISRPGRAGRIPADLAALVTVYARGVELAPVVTVRTVRHPYELRTDDRLLAEVVDDAVTVLDGRQVRTTFREIEVERHEGGPKLLDRVAELLCGAGAVAGDFTPKHVRAMGDGAAAPPDLTAPAALPRRPTAGAVVTAAVRSGVGRILAHDPLVRLGAPGGEDDDTAVRQMRVGCQRLRSDLRTFGPLLPPSWVTPLRAELQWLAGVLGRARDAEMLRQRLRRTAGSDPLCPLDAEVVDRIDAALAARQDEALRAVAEALASPRYLALVETLVAAARSPQLTGQAEEPATAVLPALATRPWRRLTGQCGAGPGAGALDPVAPDEQWHRVHLAGRKARYAVEAVAPAVGGEAPRLARRLARVQNLLGEHRNAAVAAETWLSVARAAPEDHELALTAGRLAERERASVHAVRAAFPAAWQRAAKRSRTRWLR